MYTKNIKKNRIPRVCGEKKSENHRVMRNEIEQVRLSEDDHSVNRELPNLSKNHSSFVRADKEEIESEASTQMDKY